MKLIAASLVVFLVACGSSKDEPPKKSDPPQKTEKTPDGSGSQVAKVEKPEKTEKPEKVEKPEAGSGSAGSGSAAAKSGDGDFNFSAMKTEDQIDFMKKKVVPAMKVTFQKHDPKEFGNVNCKTCHGKDPKGTKYAMPSPDLPKLDFAALEAGKDPKMVKMAKWMSEVVTPEMAKILGREMHSEKHPDGFGCLSCHMEKKK